MKARYKYVMYLVIFIATERLCYLGTGGLRDEKILSKQPICTEPQSICEEKYTELQRILNQEFYYIGKGGCCYCFASKDDKYVIKFFKQHHLAENHFIKTVALPRFLEGWRKKHLITRDKQKAHKRKDYLFTSIKIAETLMEKETGIVHVQLDRSNLFNQNLVFFDKIGVKHTINLRDTEFVIQKKATLIYTYLGDLIQNNQLDKARRAIDSLISNVEARCTKGIHDRDPHPTINFGYHDDEAIEIDLGSYSMNASLKNENDKKMEVTKILKLVQKKLKQFQWLELSDYVNQQIQTISSSSENNW